MSFLNCNIQVFVGPSLLTEEGVNAPSAIDPDFNTNRGHRSVQVNDIY